jgi:hypothetical protein
MAPFRRDDAAPSRSQDVAHRDPRRFAVDQWRVRRAVVARVLSRRNCSRARCCCAARSPSRSHAHARC